MRQTDHRHLRDCWKISMTHRKEQQCVTAVMAGSGSLGTFLCPSKGRIGYHSPQGEAKEQAGCFIWHPPRLLSKTRQMCLNTSSLLVLTSSPRINPSVTNSWLWLQIFGSLTWALLQTPTHSLYLSGAASWQWKLLSVLEGMFSEILPAWFLPSSGHHFSFFCTLSDSLRCVLPSAVISAGSGCHIQNRHRHPAQLTAWGVQCPHSDSPCTGINNWASRTIPHLHKAQTQPWPLLTALPAVSNVTTSPHLSTWKK